jgi:hypothetical protein
MATTPVTGAATGATQTQQTSSSNFDTQFANTFSTLIMNAALQSQQNLQDLLGTSPQQISDGSD